MLLTFIKYKLKFIYPNCILLSFKIVSVKNNININLIYDSVNCNRNDKIVKNRKK
jgi:hypothetical protein